MNKVDELKNKIEILEEEVKDLKYKVPQNELEEVETVFALLSKNVELKNLRKELMFEIGPDLTDGEIDLYLIKSKTIIFYDIYLSGTQERIGDIEYRGLNHYRDDGDIGYMIESSYRGNHYALKALKLIKNKVLELGAESFDIYAYDSNKPSIKTIENFGGEKYFDNGQYSKFRCNLKNK